MEKVTLFSEKKDCCACGACANICPKQAIFMKEDEYGFIYPNIDEDKCIKCGVCKKVCAYQNTNSLNEPLVSYAAFNKDQAQIMKSASGGVFAAMASKILNESGVVVGAALEKKGKYFLPHHIAVTTKEELSKIQGSKYVQSATENTYQVTLQYLKQGKKVLYSGTPCQIDGLYGFLGKKYDNLITVDLICHGVPSAKFFNDYIETEICKMKAREVVSYAFRDKYKGWGMNGRIDYISDNGMKKTKYIPARLSSYNTLFLDGIIYRENCYQCKYACAHRPGDLTIGDYWGIETEHPELLKSKLYDEKKGISCIIINSIQGKDFVDDLKDCIQLDESSFNKITKKNEQLKTPMKCTSKRNTILELYRNNGYKAVDKLFYKKYKKQILLHGIYNVLPRTLRIKVKRIMKGGK